ncbi:cytochrome P450 [Aspergillus novoparasiticus]|uniref:Cytochrome P450 n=1 Tax=Aspergillus novoparasiticus TaxID=986946 RepID=A0A5N6EYN7_9EURO|nr:cytochrome P450 [Aspergillus novoparasiticus]
MFSSQALPVSWAPAVTSDLEATSLSIWAVAALAVTDKYGHSIPHGPVGLPILGSFYSLTRYPELTLDYCAKRFGKLYSIWLGNQLFVIVSDPEGAKDLLLTNGNVFSSRKEIFIKSQTVFAGRGITATPRKHCRIATTWLNQRAVDFYFPTLDYESLSLIKTLFDESQGELVPVNPQPHAGRCSLNNMTTITFSFSTDSIKHPLVGQALKLSRELMNCAGPMSNLVDFVPLLQYLPTPMHQCGKKLHEDLVKTYGGIIKDTERGMKEGKKVVVDCLAKTMIEVRDKEDLDDLDMAILASAFMISGVETTAAIMQWFSVLIPSYPEIQKKAQEELDRVVGRGRLPGIEDEKYLPYCHTIIKEVERGHNPSETMGILNTWTMHYDSARHSNPETFDPDRYINDPLTSAESTNVANPMERDHWMFGAGRRICPGMLVVEREIWLTISRMLWAFDMYEIPDEPIDLKEYDGLSGHSPVPFRIGLKPRHENVAKVLQGIEI